MNANEMIKRYVHEVGNHLPRKGREDIQQELQSLLLDTLEERAGAGEPTAQMAAKVLLEFGKPAEIAQQYQPQQNLISSKLFPTYRKVTTIVLAVMTVLHLVFLAIVLWNSADPTIGAWNVLTEYVQSVLICVGIITLIFWAVERYLGDEIEVKSAEFDPFALPPVNDPNRVSRFELIAEIIASIVAWGIALSLIQPDGLLGSFVADSFRPIVGWLVASVVVDVAVKVLVLWQNRWHFSTRLFAIGSELFGLYALYRVYSADAILTIDPLNPLIKMGLLAVMGIVAIAALVKLGQLIWRRDWQRPVRPSALA